MTTNKLLAAAIGLAWSLIGCLSANAEDIEIFVGNSNPANAARPNILFILDDSISMGAETLTQNDYDPALVYPGNCDAGRVYWSTSGGPPGCATDNYFAMSALRCQRALDAFGAPRGGTYLGLFAHYDAGPQLRWEELSSTYHNRPVECASDLPDAATGWPGHGDGSNASAVYPRNGDSSRPWTADESSAWRISWGNWPTAQRYQVFSGNYLNWYYGAASAASRLQVMKDVAISTINSIDGVNVGLMHFNSRDGGLVSHAIEDVGTARPGLTSAIDALAADNFSPLEESLYEAYLYMRGGAAEFGAAGVSDAFTSPSSGIYASPIDQSCQKSHIVLLTDGEPIADQSASSLIVGLTDAEGQSFTDLVGGTCDLETYPPGFATGEGGDCLDELAEFMQAGDLSLLPGQQNVTTHTVGFHVDLPILAQTAERGGGEYHTAVDAASLSTALTNIVTNVLDTQATFTAPAVSINAFGQARHLNDVYLGLFSPSTTAHWPGNLKKYRLDPGSSRIVDANGEPIVDQATGAFVDTARDLWSSTIDGATVSAGGAANRIPASRNVYTYLGNPVLTNASNSVDTGNSALSDTLLGTGAASLPTREQVIDFITGLDASDVDQDGNLTEPRLQLGDPLHSRPAVVVYGPDNDDALVFMGTNDGYLHAFDVSDGAERWAFLPPEFLDQQVDLFVDNSSAAKIYGADGSIRIQTIADGDGVINPADGERVLLFFGMRRGGDAYYGLDVTNPDRPEVLWRKDSNDLPGAGQSWSSATPTRINIQGANQNQHQLVLVIGGGYDATQDAAQTSTDSAGNSIYFVDMLSGELLWHGTNSGGDENFSSANWSMDYSFPGDVRVIDLNGDGFADRMYAADMGGQVWRFDITNGNRPLSLVTGGVIAQLGAAGSRDPSLENTRRFYYAPDVARVVTKDANFIHIGIGSGHRAHPNSTVNHDEFYALRDYWTYTPKTQAEHNAFTPIRPADLVDVTTELAASVPLGSPGWRLSLSDGGWLGEKVLAEARTFDGRVFISTYRPIPAGASCEPALGITRLYVVSLFNARPVTNLDGSVNDYNGDGIIDPTDLTLTDRYREFEGPPPPETIFFFPGPEGDIDGDGDIDADDQLLNLACTTSGECLDETPCVGLLCFSNGTQRYPVRTFWTQDIE